MGVRGYLSPPAPLTRPSATLSLKGEGDARLPGALISPLPGGRGAGGEGAPRAYPPGRSGRLPPLPATGGWSGRAPPPLAEKDGFSGREGSVVAGSSVAWAAGSAGGAALGGGRSGRLPRVTASDGFGPGGAASAAGYGTVYVSLVTFSPWNHPRCVEKRATSFASVLAPMSMSIFRYVPSGWT